MGLAVLLMVAVGCAATPEPGSLEPGSLGPSVTGSPGHSATPAPVGSSVDVARLGYLDNLLARAEAGEWQVEQGTELTLRALLGVTALRQVLWQSELASYDLTGVLASARGLLADDPAPSLEARIRSFLRFLIFDHRQLQGMIVDPDGPQPTPLKITPPPILGPDETHMEDPFFDPASRSYDTDCELFFRRFPVGPGATTCLAWRSGGVGDFGFDVFSPAHSLAPFHWSDLHHQWIDEAVAVAAPLYTELGVLPSVDVVMAANLDAPAEAATLLNSDGCVIILYTHLQLRAEAAFKQIVARQLAHCFIDATLYFAAAPDVADQRWVRDGLATYLSSQAFPTANVELESLETLRSIADGSSLTDWSSAAFVWFQYAGARGGPAAIVEALHSMALSDAGSGPAALARWPGVDNLFPQFAQAYTSGLIEDSSLGRLQTAWQPDDNDEYVLNSTGTYADFELPPFSMRRSMLVTPPGAIAQLSNVSDPGIVTTARPYGGGSWANIPSSFPSSCLADNRLLVLITNAGLEPLRGAAEVTALDQSC